MENKFKVFERNIQQAIKNEIRNKSDHISSSNQDNTLNQDNKLNKSFAKHCQINHRYPTTTIFENCSMTRKFKRSKKKDKKMSGEQI